MMLTPTTPGLSSRAFLISRLRARMLAPRKSVKPSGSRRPMPAAAITPTPPALAVAAASPDKEIPTPIPPWTIGIRATRFPIDRLVSLFIPMGSPSGGPRRSIELRHYYII